jgi:SpoVK/Ycf46/Vps4 family AAA+-type ATPase
VSRLRDLELLLRSRTPLIVIETRDEGRMLELLRDIARRQTGAGAAPLFRWTVTDGLQRLDVDMPPQLHNASPSEVLRHIRAVKRPGTYALLDFHPYLDDPVNVRLVKDICLHFSKVPRHLVLVSHRLELPGELRPYSVRFEMALPSDAEREAIVKRVAAEWTAANAGSAVRVDRKAHGLLIRNLAGLSDGDTERLARGAIFDDGAITQSDLPGVMQAKYELLNAGGVLQFEYDTRKFSDVGGLARLKEWLTQRRIAFIDPAPHLDAPKGILLIGVQGCGKSLAAKATAGIFGIPLLRLDFGAIYNKYHGETERNLRESLRTADVMAPCVLWIDEIEKGVAGRDGETGTTQRVLATFLSWLAEKKTRVFVVATANDISALPPELVRKGRFDEIFFVDLPDAAVRAEIVRIHLAARGQASAPEVVRAVADATDGFSGAEIEQSIVSALYAAHARQAPLSRDDLLEAVHGTRPLSVVMAEKVARLRQWAAGRTVPCD